VYGASIADNGIHGDSLNGDAIAGIAHAQGKAGVLGISESSNGGNGVSGISTSGNGVFGSGGQFAGFFEGNVQITGRLTVQGKDVEDQIALIKQIFLDARLSKQVLLPLGRQLLESL
jgi:hypothetical protein